MHIFLHPLPFVSLHWI